MPYTSIKRVRNGAAVLDYVLKGEGHDGSGPHNRIVTPIYMNKDIGYRLQMNKYWKRARSNHKVQIISIVQSFSQKEFDRENYEDILKANEIGQTLVEEHYPGRQALICTQTDGEHGLVHNHILIMGEDYGPKALKEHLEIYERVVIRSEFTSFNEYPVPKISMSKTVSTEEKTGREETAVLAPIGVSDGSDTSENIPQLFLNTEDETSEEDEKNSSADLIHKKPVAKSKTRDKLVWKKHVNINGNRFDSTVHMSDTVDRDVNEKDDELGK